MQVVRDVFKLAKVPMALMLIGGQSMTASAADTLFAMHLNQQATAELQQHQQSSVYINLQQEVTSDLQQMVMNKLAQKQVLIFDATDEPDREQVQAKMTHLFGVASYAPVTLVYKKRGELVLHTIQQVDTDIASMDFSNLEEPELQTVTVEQLDFDLLAKGVQAALTRANKSMASEVLSTQSAASGRYVPISHVTHLVTHSNLACSVQKDVDGNQWEDICAGQASANLSYKLTRMRSVTASANTENAKYFRIALTDDLGGAGAGIRLSGSQSEKNTWYQSNPVRNVRRGPILQRFEFESYPTSGDSGVQLSYHKPENSNPKVNKSYTKGISLGASVSAGAEFGQEGPKVSAGASASFAFTDSRTVSISHAEYRVENNTANKHARVAWDHGSPCNYIQGDISFGCERTRPLWYGGEIFNASLFNSISYRNFVPKLDVIYRAEPDKTGVTQFKVHSKITMSAYYGKSRYGGIWAALQTWDGALSKSTYNLSFNYSVDWDHPVFQPEANVRIQSLAHNNMCLDIWQGNGTAGNQVVAWGCHNGRNQMWGLDNLERYRSHLNPGLCLAVSSDNRVVVDNCNTSLEQKWIWQGDKLTTRKPAIQGHVVKAEANKPALMVANDEQAPQWKPYLHQF